MSLNQGEIICCREGEDLFVRAAERIVSAASEAIGRSGIFRISLAGGSTPKALYSLLASEKYSGRISWDKVHLFWGDERCVPADHEESNYKMVSETLLSSVDIPAENIHRIKGEMGEAAAADYEKTLAKSFKLDGSGFPRFDLVLLGMGDDGHTASLFPGTPVLREEKAWACEVFVERLNSMRITLSPPVINSAAEILFLVSGAAKAPALREVLEGDLNSDLYPAQLLRTAQGKVTWLVDEAAYSLMT